MNRILVLTGLIAGFCGCSSAPKMTGTDQARTAALVPMQMNIPYASKDAAAQQASIVEELVTVGKALKKYKADHDGQLPPALTALVTGKYLPASALISCADVSGGKEGGVPDMYATWQQAKETDEPGSSYLYEFSAAPCGWEWKTYIAGESTPEKLDTNKDGAVSWAEVKSWQKVHGDTVQQPQGGYPENAFPVVRCFWYKYPDLYTEDAANSVVLSLAADLKTVFVSHAWWEKDFSK